MLLVKVYHVYVEFELYLRSFKNTRNNPMFISLKDTWISGKITTLLIKLLEFKRYQIEKKTTTHHHLQKEILHTAFIPSNFSLLGVQTDKLSNKHLVMQIDLVVKAFISHVVSKKLQHINFQHYLISNIKKVHMMEIVSILMKMEIPNLHYRNEIILIKNDYSSYFIVECSDIVYNRSDGDILCVSIFIKNIVCYPVIIGKLHY